jgi:hypothetical protein
MWKGGNFQIAADNAGLRYFEYVASWEESELSRVPTMAYAKDVNKTWGANAIDVSTYLSGHFGNKVVANLLYLTGNKSQFNVDVNAILSLVDKACQGMC